MTSVTFEYEGNKIQIPCLKNDKMGDTFNKLSTKVNVNVNSLYFIYEAKKIINYNLTFQEQANIYDQKRNEMAILVYKKENDDSKYPKNYEVRKIKTDGFAESVILNDQNKNQILFWLNPIYHGKNPRLTLIYRRGNDMSFETFHKKCDRKGPTLVVCKAKNEKFGGYTNISWEACEEDIPIHANGPFLFSLTKNKKYDYTNKGTHSIYLNKNHGPDFNWDFVLNHCEQKMRVCFCYKNKQEGYAYSEEPIFGDGELKGIEVDELEVFKVEGN